MRRRERSASLCEDLERIAAGEVLHDVSEEDVPAARRVDVRRANAERKCWYTGGWEG